MDCTRYYHAIILSFLMYLLFSVYCPSPPSILDMFFIGLHPSKYLVVFDVLGGVRDHHQGAQTAIANCGKNLVLS